MTITKNIRGSEAELILEGWLDTTAAPELEAVLGELSDDIHSLVIDMEKLEYISSSGLRQLVVAHRKMKGVITLRSVPDEVMEVLTIIGLKKKLNII